MKITLTNMRRLLLATMTETSNAWKEIICKLTLQSSNQFKKMYSHSIVFVFTILFESIFTPFKPQ